MQCSTRFLQGVLRTVARCSKAGISDVGIFDFREIQWNGFTGFVTVYFAKASYFFPHGDLLRNSGFGRSDDFG